MHAQEFNVNLAQITGFDETQVRTVDRVLADAGFRAKATGRKLPDVTLSEAVTLLLALCASEKLTEADRVAADLVRFTAYSSSGPAGFPAGNETMAAACFGAPLSSLSKMNLIEAIGCVCRNLANGHVGDWYVGLEIEVGGTVSMHCDAEGSELELHFTGAQDYVGHPGVETVRRVRPNVLAWIGKVAA